MLLKKIEMKNFRQFYGHHEIDFAYGDKNTTIVLGINNSGKTGLYRALMFGLYGERKLKQDSTQTGVHLVNFKALDESKLVETSVRVTVKAAEGDYVITRKIKGSKIGGVRNESSKDEVSLDFINKFGDKSQKYKNTPDEIKEVINGILDENIKEFFLFDGEKIETLARADRESRSEVKKGIIKLMEIDKLDRVKNVIRAIYNKEKNRLTIKSSNSQLISLEREIDTKNNQLVEKTVKRNKLKETLDQKHDELKEVNAQMKNIESLKELFVNKKILASTLSDTSSRLSAKKSNLHNYLFDKMPALVLSDYNFRLNQKLNKQLINQQDIIPLQVLNQSIEKGVCLTCNQDIGAAEKAYIHLMQENYKHSKLTPILNSVSNNLDKFEKERSKYTNLLKLEISEIEKLQNEVSNLKNRLEKLEEQISYQTHSEVELEQIQNNYNKLNREIILGESNDKKLGVELSELLTDINRLNTKLGKELRLSEDLEYATERLEFLRNVDEKLNIKYNEYIKTTRKILGDKTAETFKNLIDDKSKSLVDNIEINESYEMNVKYADGLNVTQDISQGQQMIVALSFITSLANLASKNEGRIEYPLFMDSPFGRLSKQNRSNLIQSLPDLTNQWIPLLTDTDFTDYERLVFKESNRVGKIYEIEKISENHSVIKDISTRKEVL